MVQWQAVETALAQHDVAVACLPPIRPHPAVHSPYPLVEDFAERAAAEIVEGGFATVVVLAHSVGSFVGFDLAARIPERVAGVIAVNGALYSVGRFLDRPLSELAARPSFGLAALRLSVVAAVPTSERVREFVLRRERLSSLVVGNLVPREVMRSETSRRVLVEGTNQRGILRGLWANRRHWPRFAATAHKISCPVVLITGTLDPLTSVEDSHLMAALFRSATVKVLEGIGHSAPLQSPEPIITVAERLAGLGPATTGGAS
jgi:pimeloyl-ACP methyl ester carboxylesterase